MLMEKPSSRQEIVYFLDCLFLFVVSFHLFFLASSFICIGCFFCSNHIATSPWPVFLPPISLSVQRPLRPTTGSLLSVFFSLLGSSNRKRKNSKRFRGCRHGKRLESEHCKQPLCTTPASASASSSSASSPSQSEETPVQYLGRLD